MRGVVDFEVDRVGVEGRVAGVEPQVDDVRPLRADERREEAERAGPVVDLDADPRGAAFRIVAPGEIDTLDVLADDAPVAIDAMDLAPLRSAEHTSELQSLMRNSYDVLSLKRKSLSL